MDTPQKPFEPDYLIRLLHAQYPQRTDVLRALQLCSGGYWETSDYIYFLRSHVSDQPVKESRVVEKLILEDHSERSIVLEVVADGRIAGIGYVTR
ncbi:MAG TPA: hypothetical protein VM101_16400 [Flavitalea sp.]|nr:hypothetical protein [Flavitalea sp.]